jgi:hypothetical protein
LHWSLLDAGRDGPQIKILAHNSSVRAEGYLAATLLRPGHVAGVSRSHIDWLRGGSKEFACWSVTEAALARSVACFPSYRTGELVIVCSDGVVVRVPIPDL